MHRVINIRGTGGSGKTHLIRAFMSKYKTVKVRGPGDPDSLFGGLGPIRGYKVRYGHMDVYLIGKYEKDGKIGGADTIRTQDLVCDRVRRYSKKGVVIFEGFIISGLYSRYKQLSDEVGGIIWAYMDTPLELCIERVGKRNKGKVFNEANTAAKYKATLATKRKALADGETVVEIRHTQPLSDLEKLLNSLEAS